MCGIFAFFNENQDLKSNFMKGKHRGPDDTQYKTINGDIIVGFHRLAINGLTEAGNQPMTLNNMTLLCNGEIYNYKHLFEYYGFKSSTGSDCEIILHLYNKFGIDTTLQLLDGVFAFVLIDNNKDKVFVARDPFGVRPLYKYCNFNDDNNVIGFASEVKCLPTTGYINHFEPGTYIVLIKQDQFEYVAMPIIRYYVMPIYSPTLTLTIETVYQTINALLSNAVYKRCVTTERPIACLLSGGLDSSLICSLVSRFTNHVVDTYSIGLQGSTDLLHARIMAEYLGTNHTEIIIGEEEMFNAIPKVVEDIENFDRTTVRASIGNYLLGKYISENSVNKVIFNGDGSDELFGGYLYMKHCPSDMEFDKECKRLLTDIHIFDVLRSDKSISSHGLEPRTPFLDKSLVNYVLSLPPSFRNTTTEKELLRRSFEHGYLPNEILWRKKEAFSDGVTATTRSLFDIIKERLGNIDESQYYKNIFNSLYPNADKVVPYQWMPKYIEATDPSARTLSIYNN